MAAAVLRSWLDGRRASVVWVEYEAYARRVFANSPDDWWGVASRYANTIVQARKVIPTDVLTFDLAAAGMAALGASSEAGLARVRAALTAQGGRAFIAETIDAIAHKLGDSTDLVLKVGAPLDLLALADPGLVPGFNELDDIAAAITSILRSLADKPIAGVLLTRVAADPLSLDEADAYVPILNAAQHYRWVTCMSLNPTLIRTPHAYPTDVDILLGPEVPVSEIRNLQTVPPRLGGGLDATFWLSAPTSFTRAGRDLLYGEIPSAMRPEDVLARAASLTII